VKRTAPTPLAFHGIGIRARDPEALARRLRRLLGWDVLRRTSREVVLGGGPELFIAIRKGSPDGTAGVDELHLAVEGIRRSRRKTKEDPLGGDSWAAEIAGPLTLVIREPKRAPAKRWAKRRSRV